MAENPTPPRRRAPNPELDTLNTEYGKLRSGFDAASQRTQTLTGARRRLEETARPELIVPRNEFQAPYEISKVPNGARALRQLDGQLAQAEAAKQAYAAPLQQMAGKYRDFTNRTQTQTLLRSAGAPVAAPSRGLPVANAALAPASTDPGNRSASAASALPNAPQLRPGDANTFTGANGITRAVPGLLSSQATAVPQRTLPPAMVAPPSTAPRVADTTGGALEGARVAALQTRADAGSMVTDGFGPEAELMRRFEISQGSYQNKGRPSSRAAAAQALFGQLGAMNQASASGQQAANGLLQSGASAQNLANEAFAQRRQDARRLEFESAAAQQQQAVEGQRVLRTLNTADGRTGALRQDGSFTPITDAGGHAVQEVVKADAGGQITPKDQLDYLGQQQKAVLDSLSLDEDQRAQQLAALDTRAQALFAPPVAAAPAPAAATGKPSLDQFLAQARKANPSATDAQLTAFYQRKYGTP
ncbi:hypothetical protein [Lysobacter firmicutimachus]|uniref:Uncharacterized protein n=1 Tax=Lysobacter firmicutimachus TaxID=1792846 RepID=A0ABU8CYJ9_9GAMM